MGAVVANDDRGWIPALEFPACAYFYEDAGSGFLGITLGIFSIQAT
jgi:hypothetical protein